MNMTSALKSGMKKIKGKLKIKTTSEGVIVEGEKCKTAKSLFKNVKKVAKKDIQEKRSYSYEIATQYRAAILTKPFTADKNSENFYKKFIEDFRNKIITPSILNTFYDEQIKGKDPKIVQYKIFPVYAALSFYAMRETRLSNISIKKSKLDHVEFLGYKFNSPLEMFEDTKELSKKTIVDLQEMVNQIFKPYNEAIDRVEKNFKGIFEQCYKNGSEFASKFSDLNVSLSGLVRGAMSFKRSVEDFINKKELHREYTAFENLGKHYTEFEKKFKGESYNAKFVDDDSAVYWCAAFFYTSKQWYTTGKAYLLVVEGKNEEAKKLISNVSKDENALKDAEKLKEMIDELNEVANCQNISDAAKVAEKHGREIKKNDLRASFSAFKTAVPTKDKNEVTDKKRKSFLRLRESKRQKRKNLAKSTRF